MSDTNNNNTNGPNVGNFLLQYTLGMIGIVLWVLFGTTWLYISKLTSSGIPTDTKYEPYTCDINTELGKNTTDGTSKKVPMNSIHELGMKGLAFWQLWSNDSPANKWEQEATFETQEFLDSFNGTFIQEFRDSANIKGTGPAAASGLDKYCSIVLNNVAARGFKWYDTFSLSDKLNDSFKIFIYGLIGLILFPLIWVLNGMCSFYYLIKAAWKQENPDNLNDGGADNIIFSTKSLGENESGWSLKYWPKRIGNGFIWMLFWFLIFPILSFFVCPLYATFMPFFKLLWSGSYSLKVDNKFYDSSERSDTKSFWDFIKDTFAYKRTFLLFLSILNLFTCANTYLGEMYFGAVALAVILAIVFGDIFVDTAPNDNTMILQQVNNTPKAPKVKRQPIHKGCMFPKEINRIDKKLHKLNVKLADLIDESDSDTNSETKTLIAELKAMRTDLNNEFTAISISDDKTKVDAFEQKVADKYESKIEELKGKIKESTETKEKEAKEAEENQKVIENIKDILKNVSTKIDNIYKNLKINVVPLGSEKYTKYLTKANDYKTQLLELRESVAKSDNKEESNNLLEKFEKLDTEVTTFETELEPEISLLNAAALSSSSNSNAAGSLSVPSSSSSAPDTSSLSAPDSGSPETDRLSITSSSSSRPSITSNNYSVPDVDRGELITYVNNRKAQSVQGEQTENPMLSAGLGTPGGQLTPKDVTQENTVSTSNPRAPLNPSLPTSVTQERSKKSSSNNDVLNPMIEMTNLGTQGGQMKSKDVTQENTIPISNALDTSKNSVPAPVTQERSKESSTNNDVLNPLGSASVGIQGGQMKLMNMTQENTVPMSNPVSKSPQVTPEEIKQRTVGAESSNTTNNPMQASATLGKEKIDGSTSPGILSNGGRLLTLTFPNNTNTTLKIGDCIEFEKDGKQQSGKIVEFYKGNNSNTFVDVIFIDLWNESLNDYIPKITKIGVKNTNVLDSFRSQNTQKQQNIIFSKQQSEKPEGIALTPLYSGNNAYNDAGVWQTIKHCNVFGEPAQKIFYQNEKNNNVGRDELTAQLDREIAATKARQAATNNNNNNQSGGSKSKTLKKKQQNIKIRLV